jgi:amino acid transporter
MTEPPESSNKPDSPYQGGYPPPPPPGSYQGGYPPPPPQPYAGGYPGYEHGTYAPAPTAPKNGLGIAALVVGILSLPAVLTVFGGFVLGLVAIVLGFIGYRRAKKGAATNGGIAIAGIVIGLLGIVLNAALIAFGVWGFLQVGGGDYFDCIQDAGNDSAAQAACEDEFRGNLENRFSVTLTPTP